MLLIDHQSVPVEWRGKDNNIEHRTLLNRDSGSSQMTMWEIFPPQNAGAPPHVHPHEETITVLSGQIKIQIEREVIEVKEGQTVFIPANAAHSFGVISEEKAHLLIFFPVDEPFWEGIDWKTWLAQDIE